MCTSSDVLLGEMYRLDRSFNTNPASPLKPIQLAPKIVKDTVSFEDNSLNRASPRANLFHQMGLGRRTYRNIGTVNKQPCDICNKILSLFSFTSHLRGHLGRGPPVSGEHNKNMKNINGPVKSQNT